MIDAHCHLDDAAFAEDRDDVVRRALHAGVQGVVLAGVHPDDAPGKRALATSLGAAGLEVWWTAGLHPWTVARMGDRELPAALEAVAAELDPTDRSGPCAIGEIGLDRLRRWPRSSWPRQEEALRAQLSLAQLHDLPIVLHVVRAHGRMLELLREVGVPPAGGMVHAFTAAWEVARDYLDLGLHLSLGGRLTYAEAHKAREVAARSPAGARRDPAHISRPANGRLGTCRDQRSPIAPAATSSLPMASHL